MKIAIHRANSRGYFDHGWLKTYHTFSFAEYFNPQRVHFGALRVLNDDTVAPEEGFGMHSHHNMEIVSIPLKGVLEHRDSMGNHQTTPKGHIQVMSAGTGVRHSEYNKNKDQNVEFLQIWILPDKKEIEPRYDDADIASLLVPNQLTEIVKPYPGDGKGVWIYQNAWFSMGKLDREKEVVYHLKSEKSYGVYVFVISGEIVVDDDIELLMRDGMGVTEADTFRIKALTDTEILLIEIPPLK